MNLLTASVSAQASSPPPEGERQPVGVLDIGSNSIRLVVYEHHARWLTPQYNEKSSAGLGRGVATTGRLSEEAVERALRAIRRFALMAQLMQVKTVHVLATSAVRETENGSAFTDAVEDIMKAPVRILSGAEEAHFAALGVVAGIPEFDGIVGDMGGGSLDMAALSGRCDSIAETYELGVLRMQDDAEGDPKKAAAIAMKKLRKSPLLTTGKCRTFAAIGGTWRSIAKLAQARSGYPLHMVQSYEVSADWLIGLCDDLVAATAKGESFDGLKAVGSSRRDLLPFGAAVLSATLKIGGFERVVFSALGLREGYLYDLLSEDERDADPLLSAATEMSALRSRSASHAEDLMGFADIFIAAAKLRETEDEKRLRRVACLLSDIGWRGHPDYRGEQSVDLIAFGAMTGIDHPGRAFVAGVLAVRYMGPKRKSVSADILDLAGEAAVERARLLGTLFRVAYPLSAGMPGILPRFDFAIEDDKLVLIVPADLEFVTGDRVPSRMNTLASVAGFKGYEIRTR